MSENLKLKTENSPLTFILVGRSGSGKSTHARLLLEYLKKRDLRDVYSLETGEHFRSFIKERNFSSERSRKLYERADLQPSFLAVYLWSRALVENLKGNEHLLIDGTPRYLDEARMLTAAMHFYDRAPTVLYLNVSREFAETKLKGRGRADDVKTEDIKRRLDWFDTSVMPTIAYLQEEPLYRFVEVNGEGTPEEVHQKIVAKLFAE